MRAKGVVMSLYDGHCCGRKHALKAASAHVCLGGLESE